MRGDRGQSQFNPGRSMFKTSPTDKQIVALNYTVGALKAENRTLKKQLGEALDLLETLVPEA